MTDADGATVLQNGLWCDYLGCPRDAQNPVRFEEVVDPEALPSLVERWRYCIETDEILETEIGLFDRLENRYVTHVLTVVPHYTSDGATGGWVGSAIRR